MWFVLWSKQLKGRTLSPFARRLNILTVILASFGFGLGTTFEGRLLHGGLGLIFLVVVALFLVSGIAFRRLISSTTK